MKNRTGLPRLGYL